MNFVQISNSGSNLRPNQKTDPKPLSFDEVSKFFNLPLSDAADSLGVCTSVLKKICYENGLVRWPYRKFLSGKSIEEIKADAAKERQERHAEMPKSAGEKPNVSANSSLPTALGSKTQNIGAAQEMPKPAAASQQQGSKNAQTLSSQHMLSFNLPKATTAGSDEFKYGFPSDGLSTVSYKWWGSRSTDVNEDTKKADNAEKNTQQSAEPTEESAIKTDKNNAGVGALSGLREKAAKEGREALKLGVYRGHGLFKLDSTKRAALLQVFKSSYPLQLGQE